MVGDMRRYVQALWGTGGSIADTLTHNFLKLSSSSLSLTSSLSSDEMYWKFFVSFSMKTSRYETITSNSFLFNFLYLNKHHVFSRYAYYDIFENDIKYIPVKFAFY